MGFGTEREINYHSTNLINKIALMDHGFEPFSKPIHHSSRINMLAKKGVKAIIIIDKKIDKKVIKYFPNDINKEIYIEYLEENAIPESWTLKDNIYINDLLVSNLISRGASNL